MMQALVNLNFFGIYNLMYLIIMLIGAGSIIFSSKIIHKILSLILIIFMTAMLWINLNADFLSWCLIMIYAGIILIFYLMSMMFDVDKSLSQANSILIVSYALTVILISILGFVVKDYIVNVNFNIPSENLIDFFTLLFNDYSFGFVLLGVCFLGLIIASINLHHDASR